MTKFDQLVYVYVCFPVSIVSWILLLLCVIIFSRLSKEATIFIYLKLEAIFILVDISVNFTLPLNYDSSVSELIRQIIHRVIFYELSSIAEMCAILMSIMAALNCICMFESSVFSAVFRLNPYLVGLAAFLFIPEQIDQPRELVAHFASAAQPYVEKAARVHVTGLRANQMEFYIGHKASLYPKNSLIYKIHQLERHLEKQYI